MGIIGRIIGTTSSTGGSQGGKGVTPKGKPKPKMTQSSTSGTRPRDPKTGK